ncbi:MAG TPA: hypothetical protein DC017_16450 [Candidatus Wallbacteria bacterium]|nr:hypothetical protein [Candidatus Wallbacteria bacterium]
MTALVSEYTYKYTRAIASDAAAVGSVIEDISISATDIAGNVATSINPSNESTKAAYTDTIAPTAAITCAPSSTVKQGAAITINAVISESLMSSPALKLAISGANTLAATDITRTDATHYTYSHTAGAGGGSATIAFSGAKDLAGNLITAAPSSGATFTIDNTTLAAATYKKVGAAPTTTVNDAFISGDTLTVGAAAGAVTYNMAANATVKSIMGQLANNNTFTIDSNGKVSAIDASLATGTPSIVLTASQCAADVSVKGFADAALTLTGSAAAQTVNLNVTGGTIAASDANLTGTITMNTAAATVISTGAKTVTVGATAAANAVGITATGGTVSIDAAASAVSINGIKVDPSVTTTVTVAGANELSAAGGATTYTIDATTTAAKTFNFITAAQTGAIAAKASEETNGLIITSATAASTGAITITGGKVNVSDADLTGAVTYNTNATATILSGTKALTIGATAAANAVGVTATGGSVSVDAAASAVTINAIKVDPNATAVITVNGANELSAAGGATNFAIDATTATAVKTFNFITTAQTGTISAKASEAVNGLTLAAAVASNGPITITGGKVDVSDADLTATVTYNTAATATVLSGTKTVTVGATAAANAVGITATGGVVSVDAAATAVSVSIGTGSTVKVNDISVTPNAAASITVNGLHELSAAGGATNYTIDATTGAAIKIFNFITTGQTGTISAKASEAVNGLTLAAAVASNGPITITGGKVDVSAVNLSGAITYDTAAAATILSGSKALTIGATTAANAVSVTATGGSVSLNAAASAVTINNVLVDPDVTAVITVSGANDLSAVGGGTNYVIDATTAAAVKTFNFITTAQTGTISAKASEAVNGLTIASATAASTGAITVTGGKIDASDADLTGTVTYNTAAAATILSGAKTLNIGATAAANAVNVTATGGIISVDAAATAVSVSVGAGTTVKVNDISITPNAAAAITVNGLHSLSAAGGATNFTLDATTAASVKTFNFITTAQTGTISAKASEAVNGLTITAAAASNGPITITGGKIDAGAANLTGNISANTANSTIVSGTKNVTTAGAFTYTITGTGLITIGDGGTAVISGVTVPGTTAATVQQTGTSLTIAGTAAGAVIVDVASAITDIILNAATTTSLTNNKAALASLTVGAAKTLTTLTNGAGNTITLLTDNGTITTISAGGAGAVITTLTLGTSGALTNPLATAGNLTITNIDQNAIAADRTIPLGSLSTTITSVKGHAVNKLTLTGTANANLTVSSGSVDVSGCAVGATFNITATGATKLTATGVNIAAISGAQAIEVAGAASATVNGAVTGLTVSGAVTTLNIGANITTPVLNALVTALNITAGTIGSISGTSGATNLNLTGGTLAGYTATTAITTSTLSGGTLTTITKAKAGGIVIGADAASANALNATITGGTGPWSIGAANSTVATSAVPGNVTAVWNSAADIVLTWAADNAGTNVTFTGNDATAAATTSGGSNVSQLIITKP